MIYTVTSDKSKQTYEGFRRPFRKSIIPPTVLAVALIEGEPDLWELDKENTALALEELSRFYRSELGYGEVRISVYNFSLTLEE